MIKGWEQKKKRRRKRRKEWRGVLKVENILREERGGDESVLNVEKGEL